MKRPRSKPKKGSKLQGTETNLIWGRRLLLAALWFQFISALEWDILLAPITAPITAILYLTGVPNIGKGLRWHNSTMLTNMGIVLGLALLWYITGAPNFANWIQWSGSIAFATSVTILVGVASLAAVLRLNSKATTALRQAGRKVGLFSI